MLGDRVDQASCEEKREGKGRVLSNLVGESEMLKGNVGVCVYVCVCVSVW